jgi:hypothetical protein
MKKSIFSKEKGELDCGTQEPSQRKRRNWIVEHKNLLKGKGGVGWWNTRTFSHHWMLLEGKVAN